jgi:hypothetical protein
MTKPIIDKSKMLTIAPLKVEYVRDQKMLSFNRLGDRTNVFGYIAAGIQFLFSLHGKKGDRK